MASNPKPSDLERIAHMRESIRRIFTYTENLSKEEFLTNELVIDAVVKNFEVLGEAAYHVSSPMKAKYPDIEWAKI